MFSLLRRYKRSRLNGKQLGQLADFSSNLSLVFLTTFIAPVFSKVDTVDVFMVTLGLIIGLVFLFLSLILLKE